MNSESAARCRARGITHVLKRTPARELARGDQIVIPGFLQVYVEDRDGYASFRVDAGTKYVVLSSNDGKLVARMIMHNGLKVDDGQIVTQSIPVVATCLKVVPVPL